MVFNSDDGFLVSETHGAGAQRGVTLGEFNGGVNTSDSFFQFYASSRSLPLRACV